MKILPITLALQFLLVGCANFETNRIAPGYIEAFNTLKSIYFDDSSLEISSEVINKIPYASALLKIGNGSQGLVILESLNGNEETWVSADGLFFVLKKGRIIRTAGIENNLIDLKTNVEIKLDQEILNSYYQYYSFDEPKLIDLRITTKQINKGYQSIKLFNGQEKKLYLVEEIIKSEFHGWEFSNQFWLDEDGFVVKSIQKISPKLPFFEIEITKKPAI